MKILNLSLDDFANFSHNNAESLRRVGVECVDLKKLKHPFRYSSQSKLAGRIEMMQEIKKADVVQIMHSWPEGIDMCNEARQKNVVVYHTGTNYRDNPARMNGIFNPNVKISFTDQCEFIGLGAKNEIYIATAVDITESLLFNMPKRITGRPYEIGHFPSNPEVKGTKKILEMLQGIAAKTYFVLNYSEAKVSHGANIERMGNCDIYVELFKPELNGKPYGCYGVSAFEAAAMGRVVVTQNIREEVYKLEYGNHGLFIANDEQTFVKTIESLLSEPPQIIKDHQRYSWNWIHDKHSYEAAGKKLKKILAGL